MRGHCGQGLLAARSFGGRSRISKFTRLVQPWRSDVPIQSVPVSPPPITSTFFPLAEMYFPSARLLSHRLLVFAVRNSIAKWMPFRFRPGHLAVKSLGLVAPVAKRTASFSAWSFL